MKLSFGALGVDTSTARIPPSYPAPIRHEFTLNLGGACLIGAGCFRIIPLVRHTARSEPKIAKEVVIYFFDNKSLLI